MTRPEHFMDYQPGAPRPCLWRRVLSWWFGTIANPNRPPKLTVTERGMDGGCFGWSITATAWWDWNAAVFAGFGTRAVVMLAAYPGIHASVALAGRWGYRTLAIGPGDVSGAAASGGWQRRLGPFVVAGVDKGDGLCGRLLSRVGGVECGWWRL